MGAESTMLEDLELPNVGPAPRMKAEFAPRVNLITGDNGLGKSFLLDCAWWMVTRRWAAEVNRRMTSGLEARPRDVKRQASINVRVADAGNPRGQTLSGVRPRGCLSTTCGTFPPSEPAASALCRSSTLRRASAGWSRSRTSSPGRGASTGSLRICRAPPLPPRVTMLFDEVESHLHPRWQRSILKALKDVGGALLDGAALQLIASTHSPLVLASAEPWFDPEQDAWLDLDLEGDPPGGAAAPAHVHAAVEDTIDSLRLNDAVCCEARLEYAEDYWRRRITLDYLNRHSPFVARELRRQQRLREEDR